MSEPDGVRPRLSILTSEEVERIHDASLRILAEVGVRVDSSSARENLRRAGGRLVDDTYCFFSADTVAEALAGAPPAFTVFDRHGGSAFTCGESSARFGIGVTNLYYEDPATGEISPFRRDHMAASVRLGHALEQYDLVSTVGVLHDAPLEQADLIATLEMVANTTKPLVLLVSDPEQFAPCLDLLETLNGQLGDKPFVLPYVNPITPLVLNADTTDKMTIAIQRGLPVIFSNYGMAGASTPITPLRTLALLNAELLAGLVFSQAVRRGAPVVLGSLPAYFDMRTMVDFYDPRSILINLACAEMMAHYCIPHAGTSGSGNGWGPDVIAAGEQWLNHLTSCVGCAGLVPFVGGNFGSKVFSPALVVYAADVIEQARAFAGGFDPGELEGLVEEIAEAGPGGGFFESSNTLRNFRTAYHTSRVFPHYGLKKWRAMGWPSAEARLRAGTVELMDVAQPPGDHDEILRKGRDFLERLAG
jgi:trimethylamine---corrinoid protein Co-methyltransferase